MGQPIDSVRAMENGVFYYILENEKKIEKYNIERIR